MKTSKRCLPARKSLLRECFLNTSEDYTTLISCAKISLKNDVILLGWEIKKDL